MGFGEFMMSCGSGGNVVELYLLLSAVLLFGLRASTLRGGENMQKADLFLLGSRNNDEFARAIRGCKRSGEETESVIAKWRSCQHLFAKVRKSEYIGAFHSSDCETIPARYECVRCGLTNRLIDMEIVLDCHPLVYDILPNVKKIPDETTEWKLQQPEISEENLLSKDLIETVHPGILFDIAVELCLTQEIRTTKKNIFNVMKELCEMETSTESLKISTVVHASALIERYKEKHDLYVDE